MSEPYSMDLRERVVAAVEEDGLSAAARFGVGARTAISWVQRFRETGSVAPAQIGGYKPKAISGQQWSLEDDDVPGRPSSRPYRCECSNYLTNAGYGQT